MTHSIFCHPIALLSTFVFCLAGCSPKYDWREVHGVNAPFSVLLPAKPASLTKEINLDGQIVMMTMTAAEVDRVTFAVGTATMPTAAAAGAGINSMKTALVNNIRGRIQSEKLTENQAGRFTAIDIVAIGSTAGSQAKPVQLVARFVAKDERIYQILIVGQITAMMPDAVDTFLTSFKLK